VLLPWLIGVTGYRAMLSPRKGAVVWLGVAYFGVGGLALLYLLKHHTAMAPAESIMLWASMGSKLLAALSLLIYVLLPAVPQISEVRRQLALLLATVLVALTGGLLWASPSWLPPLRTPTDDPHPWLLGLENLIAACGLLAVGVIWQRRSRLEQECLLALMFAAALMAAASLFFLRADIEYSTAALALGHVCQIAAYLYVFHATLHEALRRPLEHLQTLYERENATLAAAPDGVLWIDQAGTIVLANPAMRALSGYEPSELLGQNVAIFLPPHLRAKHADSMRAFFHEHRSRPMGVMDLKLYRKDGQTLAVDISLGYWEVNGKPHAIAYLRDLTERKRLEESLRHRATHDELTGLPNRWLFQLQLKQALLRAQRNGERVAVLFLDLDRFKAVNDTFGHAVGDALLVQASRRIQSVLRASDMLSRMGGDEFDLAPERWSA